VGNRLLFQVSIVAADSTRAPNVVAGQEVELVRFVLDHTRTAGAGACTGCSTPAVLGADAIWLYSTDGRNIGSAGGTHVTWQDPSVSCRAAVPVSSRTWGQLKSLYR
jgi:hypothetical protein